MDDIMLLQLAIMLLLVVSLLLAVEGGFRIGRRQARGHDRSRSGETGAIQGAMLGLLGLLLGFSFAGASGRFMERQDLISREANIISTAYLRAGLLDEPARSGLQSELARYTAHRVAGSSTLRRGLSPTLAAEVAGFHERIWTHARRGVEARPDLTIAVLGPVNDVLDSHATRLAASRKHLPGLVVGLLIVCSLLTLGVIGYAAAFTSRRNTFMTSVVAMLVAAALWTTIDLDRSRIGMIQISDAPLRDLGLVDPFATPGDDAP